MQIHKIVHRLGISSLDKKGWGVGSHSPTCHVGTGSGGSFRQESIVRVSLEPTATSCRTVPPRMLVSNVYHAGPGTVGVTIHRPGNLAERVPKAGKE